MGMSLLIQSIALGLIGVFCILDSRLLGRLNFEQPLITCTLVGIVLGDVKTGLAVGVLLEPIALGLVHVGAAAPPDMNMAAIIVAALTILTGATPETALTLAVPISVLGQMLGVLMRTILSSLTHYADNAIDKGEFVKARRVHIFWGTLLYSIMYFVPIFLAIFLGTNAVENLVSVIPGWLTAGLGLASKFLVAYGLALLLNTMLSKNLTPFFFLGFFIVAYLNLSMTAVAIFACLMAFILSNIRFKSGGNSENSSSDILDDYDPLED